MPGAYPVTVNCEPQLTRQHISRRARGTIASRSKNSHRKPSASSGRRRRRGADLKTSRGWYSMLAGISGILRPLRTGEFRTSGRKPAASSWRVHTKTSPERSSGSSPRSPPLAYTLCGKASQMSRMHYGTFIRLQSTALSISCEYSAL